MPNNIMLVQENYIKESDKLCPHFSEADNNNNVFGFPFSSL